MFATERRQKTHKAAATTTTKQHFKWSIENLYVFPRITDDSTDVTGANEIFAFHGFGAGFASQL